MNSEKYEKNFTFAKLSIEKFLLFWLFIYVGHNYLSVHVKIWKSLKCKTSHHSYEQKKRKIIPRTFPHNFIINQVLVRYMHIKSYTAHYIVRIYVKWSFDGFNFGVKGYGREIKIRRENRLPYQMGIFSALSLSFST